MKPILRSKTTRDKRKNERGAALLNTMLVSMLLLTAGGALILTTSLSTTNSVDASAEVQAYYAAEAGLQESLNVLRGNVTTPTFTFATAGYPSGGNKSGDSATYSRLSNWLSYGNTTAYQDRVTLTPNYSPLSGMAYSVAVYHPDAEAVASAGSPPKTDNWNKNSLPPGATPEATPSWHQWHCGHCSWLYSHHASCTHKHCTGGGGSGRATVDETRLLVQSTGYGPKGAIKNMEMIVKRTPFDYNEAAATVTLVGPANNSAPITMNMTQDGDKQFSGNDKFSGSTALIAAFGFTSSGAQSTANTYIATLHDSGKPVETPKTLLLDGSTTPSWVSTADDARVFLAELRVRRSDGTLLHYGKSAAYHERRFSTGTFRSGFSVPSARGRRTTGCDRRSRSKDAEWDGLVLVR
jgi:hypothetical protein